MSVEKLIKHNFITMKCGSLVRVDSIIAVRLREPLPDQNLGPAVIVDYTNDSYGGVIVNQCADAEEQQALFQKFCKQLED